MSAITLPAQQRQLTALTQDSEQTKGKTFRM